MRAAARPVYLACLLAGTTVVAVAPRAITARFWTGLPAGLLTVGLTTAVAVVVGHEREIDFRLAVAALIATAAVRLIERRWSWLGAHRRCPNSAEQACGYQLGTGTQNILYPFCAK